jgi:hypothetical protein
VTKEVYMQYTREVSTMHALHVRTWRRLSQGQFPTPTVEEKGEQGGDHHTYTNPSSVNENAQRSIVRLLQCG